MHSLASPVGRADSAADCFMRLCRLGVGEGSKTAIIHHLRRKPPNACGLGCHNLARILAVNFAGSPKQSATRGRAARGERAEQRWPPATVAALETQFRCGESERL